MNKELIQQAIRKSAETARLQPLSRDHFSPIKKLQKSSNSEESVTLGEYNPLIPVYNLKDGQIRNINDENDILYFSSEKEFDEKEFDEEE
jgi:hypothetical protein